MRRRGANGSPIVPCYQWRVIATDIQDVIRHLDRIVDDAKTNGDVLGYFAAMYRAVTKRIASDIAAGKFEDGPRMDRLDTTFANFYLRAHAAQQAGNAASRPWQTAFAFAAESRAGVFQHLLLGMNAHINFDLAQAVVFDPAVASDLPGLQKDYAYINAILKDLLNPLQDAVEAHIAGARSIDLFLGQLDETFAGWEIDKAREHAWEHAIELAAAPNRGAQDAVLDHMGRFTVELARRRLTPRLTPTAAAWAVARWLERTDVRGIIESIESVT
jgi:Family of unknown function (DUF5995)